MKAEGNPEINLGLFVLDILSKSKKGYITGFMKTFTEHTSITQNDLFSATKEGTLYFSQFLRALAKHFMQDPSITELDLKNYGILNAKADGIDIQTARSCLATVTKEKSSLKTVNLSGNKIDDDGAKTIAAALKVNRSITTLDLSDNDIDDEGALAIAEALKEIRSITKLDLTHNKIGPQGKQAINDATRAGQDIILSHSTLKPWGVRCAQKTSHAGQTR